MAGARAAMHFTDPPYNVNYHGGNETREGIENDDMGSTLMACELENRTCYTMELDPQYCQVIIDRWEEFTKWMGSAQKAVQINQEAPVGV